MKFPLGTLIYINPSNFGAKYIQCMVNGLGIETNTITLRYHYMVCIKNNSHLVGIDPIHKRGIIELFF